ncbi:MAG: phage tail protein [Marinobacterium sp.]|nr:phage tail protein [Marinobacterium sp.]
MKRSLQLALATLTLAGAATTAQAGCGEMNSVYIGSICATAAPFCPPNTMDADGRELPLMDYQALFSVIGPIYGGDGRVSFKLPNLNIGLDQGKYRIPPQMKQCIVVDGIYPPRP